MCQMNIFTLLSIFCYVKIIQRSKDNENQDENRRNLSLTKEFCELNKRQMREREKFSLIIKLLIMQLWRLSKIGQK